jgi:hypothetical protein
MHSATDYIRLLCCKMGERKDQQNEDHRKQPKAFCSSCDDAVIPREYGKLVQASDKVPARSRVACDKDSECEYGECVHLQRHAKRCVRASVVGVSGTGGAMRDRVVSRGVEDIWREATSNSLLGT